jgi:hypothetical protein
MSPEERDRARAVYAEYVTRGLELLYKHYRIDILERLWQLRKRQPLDPKDRPFLLALELAKRHVPYFQPRTDGRKPDRVSGLKLALAVAEAKRKGAKSDLEAIEKLQTAGKLKKQNPDDVRRKLTRARKDPAVQYYLRVAEDMPEYRSSRGYRTLIKHAMLGQNL